MRDFSEIKRIVIKIGTKILSSRGSVDPAFLETIAGQTAALKNKGYQVLIVTSGAIGMGAGKMGIDRKITDINLRQACAAVGQPLLMSHYDQIFSEKGMIIAQVLVTRDNFNQRDSYLNLKNAVETLLVRGIVPIFNENDSVSTKELGPVFGDNDSLSAHIASKLDAELLILLSDIDACYDKDPRIYKDAKPLDVVEDLSEEIRRGAGKAGSEFATGGMETKIKAVEIARKAGCRVVIADGKAPGVITRILDGEKIGTLFLAGEKMSSRKRWIYNSIPVGRILVDEGAVRALKKNKSLLPSGVTGIEGLFKSGDVVFINDAFKAVTSLNSQEIISVTGKHSSEIQDILGKERRDDIARPEDIVEI